MTLTPTAAGSTSSSSGAVTRILDTTLSSAQASFDSNTILGGNIAGTFNHLWAILLLRETSAVTLDVGLLRVNADTGGNYNYTDVNATGGTPASATVVAQTGIRIPFLGTASSASKFALVELMFPCYAQATGTPQRFITGRAWTDQSDATASDKPSLIGATWRSTAAITRLAFTPGGGNIDVGSRFTLYGLS